MVTEFAMGFQTLRFVCISATVVTYRKIISDLNIQYLNFVSLHNHTAIFDGPSHVQQWKNAEFPLIHFFFIFNKVHEIPNEMR